MAAAVTTGGGGDGGGREKGGGDGEGDTEGESTAGRMHFRSQLLQDSHVRICHNNRNSSDEIRKHGKKRH